MKRKIDVFCAIAAAGLVLFTAGCAGYRWTSDVPEELRTVAVPVFENRTYSAELGPITTQFVLREFQREGTFGIRRTGDSALEVQGVVVDASRQSAGVNRSYGSRANEYRYTVAVKVTLINKKTGKILFSDRRYEAETTFLTFDDLLTAQRNAASRIAQEFARQIVDDVLAYPYEKQADAR